MELIICPQVRRNQHHKLSEENNNNAKTVLNIIVHMLSDKDSDQCSDFDFNNFISALNLYSLQEAIVMLKLTATN